MSDPTFICPQPIPWNDIHRALTAFHRKHGSDAPPPPVPLILAGWAYSSDQEKAARWQATLAWAERYGASHLIPELTEPDRYALPTVRRTSQHQAQLIMSTYTGIYVQRHSDGTIFNVQVRDPNGHETGLSPEDYENRGILPPIDQLPTK